MNCELNLRTIYFSATGTSKKIALAISQSIATEFVVEDITFQSLQNTSYATDDLLCIAVPVYGGGVVPVALKRLDAIRGNNTPAVVVVVYGNRNFERAAVQMSDFLAERGFVTIAVAAFVGEHSYSTEQSPIAVGRPMVEDINDANRFGELVKQKLTKGLESVDVSTLQCPDSGEENVKAFVEFVKGYQAEQAKNPVKLLPITDENRCVMCGVCVDVCPMEAIDREDVSVVDPTLCIKCCACVKECPKEAKLLNSPFAPMLSKYFSQPKPNVWVI
ncbi:MAG: EFR1 family ferrodoxin [Paludibacteraceae bacterium]|nr:EFR1 family ferrodoxin [Paludibacteraceae bacterium]